MSDIIPWMAPWSGRILALLVAAAGAVIVWRALFRDRSRGRLRCPKCWYDATGLPSTTCPECGHTVRNEAERQRTRRYWRTAMMGVFVIFLLPVFVVQRRVRQYGWDYYLIYGPGYWLFPTVLEESHQVAGYEIRIERDRRDPWGPKSICVLKDGDEVFQATGDQWHVGGYVTGDSPGPFAGVDMNGNGVPDLLLQESPAGAHPPAFFHIFELVPETIQVLGEIPGVYSAENIQDLNGDGSLDILAYDLTFDYWKTYHAASPMPRVIYSPDAEGKYVVSAGLMKQLGPSHEEIDSGTRQAIEELGNAKVSGDGLPNLWDCSSLWRTMLNLIYCGRAGEAYQFCDKVWPKNLPGKKWFLIEFQEQLGRSPYWALLAELGHPKLPVHVEIEKSPAGQ